MRLRVHRDRGKNLRACPRVYRLRRNRFLPFRHIPVSGLILLASSLLGASAPDEAAVTRQGNTATLIVHTFRPLEAVSEALLQFGISARAEDPWYQFRGDLMDISFEEPKLRRGTLVPRRWRFQIQFALNPDGSVPDADALMRRIATAANAHCPFAYRIDDDEGAYTFVPTRTRDARGRSIAVTPLLDRRINLPAGTRTVSDWGEMISRELSRQTGLQVSCCGFSGNEVWEGMQEISLSASDEPAREVLKRLSLGRAHLRCDREECMIQAR